MNKKKHVNINCVWGWGVGGYTGGYFSPWTKPRMGKYLSYIYFSTRLATHLFLNFILVIHVPLNKTSATERHMFNNKC